MGSKIFFATFIAIFFAELADKTQLVGLGMSAKSGKPLTVWMGSVCAYMVVTAFSVAVGVALAHYLKPEIVKICGALIFILVGVLILLGKI